MPCSGYAYAIIGGPDLAQLYTAIKDPGLSINFKMMFGFLHADSDELWFEPLLDRYVSFMASIENVSLDEENGDGVILTLRVTEIIDYSQRLTQYAPLSSKDFVRKGVQLQLSYNIQDCVGGFGFGMCSRLIDAGYELLRVNEEDDNLPSYDTISSKKPCQIISLGHYLKRRQHHLTNQPASPCRVIDFETAAAKFTGRVPTAFRFSSPKRFRYLVTRTTSGENSRLTSAFLRLLIR